MTSMEKWQVIAVVDLIYICTFYKNTNRVDVRVIAFQN